jgi:hypothetical protein
MIVKKIYILVNKMTIILNNSIFDYLTIQTFNEMFKKEETVVVNGRECSNLTKLVLLLQ